MKIQPKNLAFKYILTEQDNRHSRFFYFFHLIFPRTLFLPVLCPQFSAFQEKLTVTTGCLTKLPLEGVYVCVPAL